MDALATSERVEPEAVDEPAPRSTQRLIVRVIAAWSVVVVLVLAAAWLFIGTGSVAGSSMEPTLSDHDTLVVAKRSTPEVGDVVTARVALGRNSSSVVKRVIGVAGDELSYADCRLTRNGELVDEPFVHPEALVGVCGEAFDATVVPEGTVWLMGDNRAHSSDSRVHGPFDLDQIDGVLLFSF